MGTQGSSRIGLRSYHSWRQTTGCWRSTALATGASSRPSARRMTPEVQARLIHAALQRLNVECPIVVGFSWGGGLSLIYGLQHPGETCGLVLITPRAFPDGATRSLAYQLGRTPVLGDIFRHSVMLPIARRIIRNRLAAGYAPDAPVREHVAAASEMWSRPGQAEATVWDSRNLDEALRSYSVRYHEITGPVVIVVGDHDRPDREAIPLSKKIRGAELVLLPRTGHLCRTSARRRSSRRSMRWRREVQRPGSRTARSKIPPNDDRAQRVSTDRALDSPGYPKRAGLSAWKCEGSTRNVSRPKGRTGRLSGPAGRC
jgi:pimeloyl-ACP methyl ester carboxylesterase